MKRNHHEAGMNLAGAIIVAAPWTVIAVTSAVKAANARRKKNRGAK